MVLFLGETRCGENLSNGWQIYNAALSLAPMNYFYGGRTVQRGYFIKFSSSTFDFCLAWNIIALFIFKESPHLETSFKDMKKTRNLESYVQWFNRLSYFVATEVCKVYKQLLITYKYIHVYYRIKVEKTKIVLCPAREKETASPSGRVLDRDGPRVLQHWQLQFADGDNRWTEHVADIAIEEDRECDL